MPDKKKDRDKPDSGRLQGTLTSKPTPGSAEGSREDVEATLGDEGKDGLDRNPKSKGNVTVGRTPGKAEGERWQKKEDK